MNVQAADPGIDATMTAPRSGAETVVLPIILAVAFCHLLNDVQQSLIQSIYPVLKDNLALSFGQVGLITLVFQGTASILQPLVGLYTDRHPLRWSLPVGMGCTLAGLLLLAAAHSFAIVLVAVALVGLGSAVFHPDASRISRLAAGPRPGMAQSLFQVGGNAGSALGPLFAAFIVVPFGQVSVAWSAVIALMAILILSMVSGWFAREGMRRMARARARAAAAPLPRAAVVLAMSVLVALCFSKFVYMATFSTYYTFYLIERFGISVPVAQLHLFGFLAAVALGTFIGGPIGDRIGRSRVIWVSILGVMPFSLLIPHAGFEGTVILSAISGLILASAFPAMVVYAQDLMPTRVGLVAGLFFGLAFGVAGIGAAVVGDLADRTSITHVFSLCVWLPAIGVLALLLPNHRSGRA